MLYELLSALIWLEFLNMLLTELIYTTLIDLFLKEVQYNFIFLIMNQPTFICHWS